MLVTADEKNLLSPLTFVDYRIFTIFLWKKYSKINFFVLFLLTSGQGLYFNKHTWVHVLPPPLLQQALLVSCSYPLSTHFYTQRLSALVLTVAHAHFAYLRGQKCQRINTPPNNSLYVWCMGFGGYLNFLGSQVDWLWGMSSRGSKQDETPLAFSTNLLMKNSSWATHIYKISQLGSSDLSKAERPFRRLGVDTGRLISSIWGRSWLPQINEDAMNRPWV